MMSKQVSFLIYPFTAKPELWRLAAKMKPYLILGLTLIRAALAVSTATANPAYQNAGEWRSYPTPARVTALTAEGDMVWAGTPAGLIRFNQSDGTSVTYTTADGLTSNDISAVAIDPDGRPWVGAWDGITIFNPDQSLPSKRVWFGVSVTSDFADQFTRLAAAPDGPVWAVNSTHLVQVEGQTPRLFDLPAGLREKITANPSRAFSTVTDLVAATEGTVWLSTKTDLYRFTGGNWHHFTPVDGLPAEAVLRLTVDTQNQLWVIFEENDVYSLARFQGEQWLPQLLPDIIVAPTGLAVMPGGEIWLSVPGRTPFRFDGSQWTQPVEGWNAGSFDMFLAASPAGGVWFGSDNGWQRWTGHNWQELEVTIPAPFSYPAAVDANGGAWGIVTGFCYWCKQANLDEYGAVYVTSEQSCRFTAIDGGFGGPPLDPPLVRPDALWDIALGADGRVWFIAQGKIIVFSPQRAVCDYVAPETVRIAE